MSAPAETAAQKRGVAAPASFVDAQKARATELLTRDVRAYLSHHRDTEELRAAALAAQSQYHAAAAALRRGAQNIIPRLAGKRLVLDGCLLTPLPDNATLHVEKIDVL